MVASRTVVAGGTALGATASGVSVVNGIEKLGSGDPMGWSDLYGGTLGLAWSGLGVKALTAPRMYGAPVRTATARISGVGRGLGGNSVVDSIAGEAQGALSQANRILQAGCGKTIWARVYQRVSGRGDWFEQMALRNALHSESERLMLSNRYVLEAIDAGYVVNFNRGSMLGIRSPKGALLRPDIQIGTPCGRWGIVDWASESPAAKIFKYGSYANAPWLINVTLP
jgi:hypothetical protein